jgi:hypothetical protein
MIIARNSWHARLHDWYWHQYNVQQNFSNLCPYMRIVFIKAPLLWLFLRGVVTIKGRDIPVFVFTYTFLLIEVPRWVGMVSYDLKDGIYHLYMVFVCCIVAMTALGAIIMGILWFTRFYTPPSAVTAPFRVVSKTSHLIGAFFKAIHDRVCPVIEFTK